jgi:hypothetical protein
VAVAGPSRSTTGSSGFSDKEFVSGKESREPREWSISQPNILRFEGEIVAREEYEQHLSSTKWKEHDG